MIMDSGGKLVHSPQNISGASQQNSVAASSRKTEVDANLFWNGFEKKK